MIASKRPRLFRPGKTNRCAIKLLGQVSLQRGPGYFARESGRKTKRPAKKNDWLQRGPGYFARESWGIACPRPRPRQASKRPRLFRPGKKRASVLLETKSANASKRPRLFRPGKPNQGNSLPNNKLQARLRAVMYQD